MIPGAALMMLLASVYATFHQVPAIDAVFFGIKAAVLAIVVEAVVRIGRRALKTPTAVGIAALAFVALFVFAAPFPVVIAASALAGALGLPVRPSASSAAAAKPVEPSLIDRLFAVLQNCAPDSSLALTTKGAFYVNYAWDARGGDWAKNVTDKGWKLFNE